MSGDRRGQDLGSRTDCPCQKLAQVPQPLFRSQTDWKSCLRDLAYQNLTCSLSVSSHTGPSARCELTRARTDRQTLHIQLGVRKSNWSTANPLVNTYIILHSLINIALIFSLFSPIKTQNTSRSADSKQYVNCPYISLIS
eukprot:sb/3474296/